MEETKDSRNLMKEIADDVLFHVIEDEHVDGSTTFHEFVSAVLNFASVNSNKDMLEAVQMVQKRQLLQTVIMKGIERFFGDSEEYKHLVRDLFTIDTTQEDSSYLIFHFMKMVQMESVGGVRIPGDTKAAFVKKAVSCFLEFTDLSEEAKTAVKLSVNSVIAVVAMAKNGMLPKFAKQLKSKCWCF